MRVLITGVTGFIGSFVAKELLREGFEVAGFARATSKLPELMPGLRMYSGSLTDHEAVRWTVHDFQPHAVLHLGAVTPVAYSFDHPQEVIETNLLGTVNLAESCRKEASVERFIFASSMEVYGDHRSLVDGALVQDRLCLPFKETDEPRPACPYAVAKLAAEKYLQYMGWYFQFPWMALRQTNTYGRMHDTRFVVEALVSQMLKGGQVIAGDPRPWRNLIFIDDLVALYKRLLQVDFNVVRGEVYNIGPANAIRISDLAWKLAYLTGWNGEIFWNQLPPRPGEIFWLSSNNDKLKQRTGWEPKVDLENGLARVIMSWRSRA